MTVTQVEKWVSRAFFTSTLSSYGHGAAAALFRGHAEPYLAEWAGHVSVTSLVFSCGVVLAWCLLALNARG